MKIMLTDRALKAMKPAAPGTRKTIWDAAVPSFAVRVTERGKITFIVMRRLNGKVMRWTIGRYPVMPLSEAREAALAALRDIGRRIAPKEKRTAQQRLEVQRKANSFGVVAEEFINRHVKRLKSAKDVIGVIRRDLVTRWFDKPIVEITRRDILAALAEIADCGQLAKARKTYAVASGLFKWAVERGTYGLEVSPCVSISLKNICGSAEARARVLSDSEIRALWKATECLGYPAGPFVRMLILTGQRLREVAQMSWSEIDLDGQLWTIPPERMKGGAAHEIPLAQAAIDILKSLPRWHGGDFVFSVIGGARPISGFSRLKRRIDAVLGGEVVPWRFHDLRRTMRTGLGGLPIPSNICELAIGHAQPGLHKVYDRHSYREEKRRAFELWAARITEITGDDSGDKVVRLRSA
jgi:integrase